MRLYDLESVMTIEQRSFRSPWSRQVFLGELERDWAYLRVVKDSPRGPVLAFVNFWKVHDEIHILNLATHPEERRKGHAVRLLENVMAEGRRSACRLVTLEVRKSNEPAIRLYRRFGFRPIGIRPNYYPEDNEDAVVMLADLTGEP